jgi:hypothetical protein
MVERGDFPVFSQLAGFLGRYTADCTQHLPDPDLDPACSSTISSLHLLDSSST